MAIVYCEHHTGLGLCDDCAREQDRKATERGRRARDVLRANEMLLRRAADVLSEAGEYGLATQIRALVR